MSNQIEKEVLNIMFKKYEISFMNFGKFKENGILHFFISRNEKYMKLYNFIENHKNEIDINKKNSRGWTPLMFACLNSKNEDYSRIVELLLSNGAEPDIQNNNGETALMLMSKYKGENINMDIVRTLVFHYKADVDIRDNEDSNALLEYYKSCRNLTKLDFQKFLIKCNINLNVKNNHGETILHRLCKDYFEDGYDNSFRINNINLLLKSGADPNIKDKAGNTVLDYLDDYYYFPKLKKLLEMFHAKKRKNRESDFSLLTKVSVGILIFEICSILLVSFLN